jgi:urea transporter
MNKIFIEYIDVILFSTLVSGILIGIFLLFYGEAYLWATISLLCGSLLSVTGIVIFTFNKKD